MATPYMSLTLPTVSTTAGPQWATLINAALTLLDSHDHAPGFGRQVRTAGLNIDADLSFGDKNATAMRSVRFQNQAAPLSLLSDVGCIYESGGNLYYNSSAGAQVQITSGAGLNAASIGGIGGDYVTSGASVFYTAASTTFSFWQAANKSANLDAGKLTIREPGVTSANGITLQSPTGLAAAYNLTLPTALPAATKILTLGNTGTIAAVYDVDGTTIEVASNIIRVKDGGITAAKTGAVSTATPSTHVIRDAAGRAAFVDPAAGSDAATKQFVEQRTAANIVAGTNWSGTVLAVRHVIALHVGSQGGAFTAGVSPGATICTLPTDYRPLNTLRVALVCTIGATTAARAFSISTAGALTNIDGASFAAGDVVYIDGLSFFI